MFDQEKANDDEALPGAEGIDLANHLDVFHAIYKQVSKALRVFVFYIQDLTDHKLSTGSGKGLVPDGTKPVPEPMMT